MGKIIVLDENTANKIAAGEVVERPASIVKELVENSIDAGATNISVDIKSGGVKYIRITDNGCGIDADDAVIAFERHATSKIKHADDLFSIITLGFRGEALASIAAVSNLELTTRTKDSEIGTFVKISGGKLIEHSQIGCPVGTTIIVRDLFFNTPARFKFLKKDLTEATYVVDMLSRIALARTDISFKLTGAFANRNEVFHTPGNNDLNSAVYNVFGREFSLNTRVVNYEADGIKVTGVAGSPEIARANRNSQIVFLNRRYIKSRIISAAADEAYKTFLMKNKFPFFVINLDMNPSTFDVNVHPAKLDVRFSNEGHIFGAVYHALSNAIQQRQVIKAPLEQREHIYPTQPSAQEIACTHEIDCAQEIACSQENTQTVAPEMEQVSLILKTEIHVPEKQPFLLEKQPHLPKIEKDLVFPEKDELLESIYVGQIFHTYLIFQLSSRLFLIDQHAAHERIKYEELLERHQKGQLVLQQLVVPKVLDLSNADLAVYHEHSQLFEEMGFEIEPFGGNAITVRQLPCEIDMNKIEEVVSDLLVRLANSQKNTAVKDDELLYIIACKAAVKGNTKLDAKDATKLLHDLVNMKNPLSCPHGRPTILRVERRDFEKLFKRII